MLFLFFWPLPVEIFTALVALLLGVAVLLYVYFPEWALQGFKFLCFVYSFVTAFYVLYSLSTLQQSDTPFLASVSLRTALLELGVLAFIGIGSYFIMKNRAQKERL